MFRRVVSYPDGIVIFYYNNKRVTIPKSGVPITDEKIYNKKELYGLLDRSKSVYTNSGSFSWDKLYDAVSTFDRVARRNS